MIKRITGLFLVVAMLVATSAFASTEVTQLTYEGLTPESYVVTVPASLAPGTSGTVNVEGTWPASKTLKVMADTSVTLTNNINALETKALAITFDGIDCTGSNTQSMIASQTVSIAQISGVYFGTWSGSFDYTVSMEEAYTDWDATADDMAAMGLAYYSIDATSVGIGTSASATSSGYTGTATTLDIPSSIDGKRVTAIGPYAFKECSSLTSVTIPNSVTCIGPYTFCGCSSITSLIIPDSVTSIGENAFYDCASITSIVIPDSVTSIGNTAFYGCTHLTSVAIGSGVTAVGISTFSDCYRLTNIAIPDSVTTISGNAFCDCTSLTDLIIPSSVTSIDGYAFYRCTSLTNITIPNSVTSIGESAFNGCTSLANIDIPSSVTSIGRNALSKVSHVAYSGTATGSPWGAKSVNDKCQYTPDNKLILSKDSTTVLSANGNIDSCTIPNSVMTIGANAFYHCTNLSNITIPDSIISIEDNSFYDCAALTKLNIPDSVTSIGGDAFYNVPHISYAGSATGSPWGAKSVNNECQYTPDNKLILSLDGTTLLSANGNIDYCTIPNTVTEISTKAFSLCTSLTSAIIPDSVTTINSYAFCGCTSLTDITFPNSVTRIGYYAFKGCISLTDINIPNSVTSISELAFYLVPHISYTGHATGSPWGAKAIN